ncbi:hypothetical protein ACWGH5_27900 [Streptomyces sp. NPDC054864]
MRAPNAADVVAATTVAVTAMCVRWGYEIIAPVVAGAVLLAVVLAVG